MNVSIKQLRKRAENLGYGEVEITRWNHEHDVLDFFPWECNVLPPDGDRVNAFLVSVNGASRTKAIRATYVALAQLGPVKRPPTKKSRSRAKKVRAEPCR